MNGIRTGRKGIYSAVIPSKMPYLKLVSSLGGNIPPLPPLGFSGIGRKPLTHSNTNSSFKGRMEIHIIISLNPQMELLL